MRFTKTTALALSIVLAMGVLLGMCLSAWYAAEAADRLPDFVGEAFIKLAISLGFFIMSATGLLIIETLPPARQEGAAIE